MTSTNPTTAVAESATQYDELVLTILPIVERLSEDACDILFFHCSGYSDHDVAKNTGISTAQNAHSRITILINRFPMLTHLERTDRDTVIRKALQLAEDIHKGSTQAVPRTVPAASPAVTPPLTSVAPSPTSVEKVSDTKQVVAPALVPAVTPAANPPPAPRIATPIPEMQVSVTEEAKKFGKLSGLRLKVLEQIAAGKNNIEIADLLNVSRSSVGTAIYQLYEFFEMPEREGEHRGKAERKLLCSIYRCAVSNSSDAKSEPALEATSAPAPVIRPPPQTSVLDEDDQDAVHAHVARRLAELRTLGGMSQECLGDQIDMTAEQIEWCETGVIVLNVAQLWFAAKALDVPVTYFYEGL